MRRFLMILWILCNLCVSAHAQMSERERAFHEMFDIRDATPCPSEVDILRSEATTGCTLNSFTRGKEYAPVFVPNETDPIMTIRINLIFIQKDDGSGNFQANNQEHQLFFDDVITDLNRRFSSLVLPDSACFIGTDNDMMHDVRIRFVDHRYYIRKSSVWDNNLANSGAQLCPNHSTWFLSGVDDSIHQALPNDAKAINIYFTEDATMYHRCWEVQNLNDTSGFGSGNTNNACSMWPNYNDWSSSSCLHMPCVYSKYWWMKNIVPQLASLNYPSWENEVRIWHINSLSMSLAHELGHSFNLYHPTDESSSNSFYPSSLCKATIMYPGGNDGTHDFLPPKEIGRMYVSTMTTNLQQFIPSGINLGIKEIDTTITFHHMRMYYSLVIGASGDVSMPCDIIFSPSAYINVKNGGVLTIDGASLSADLNGWRGITVQSGGQLILSNTNINDYNITVNSGGSLIIKNNLSISGDHFIQIANGGYLCVDNSASISLINEFSVIAVAGSILGCPSCAENCIGSLGGLTTTGDGRVITYTGTDYIQNIDISSNYLSTGNSVYVGYNVTDTKPEGNVIVENGGELRIKAYETILTAGVEIEFGGKLQISK